MQQPPIKNIVFDSENRSRLLEGVEKINKAVGSTLGPMGRNVIIETPYGATTVTKDGVTVAKHIALEDPIENLAVSIIKQAASRTAITAGDGTTTSTVIASSLVRKAFNLISLGTPPIEIKKEFESLLHKVRLQLTKLASPVETEDILKIATISANNDEELGQLIQTAFDYVGREGLITLGESKTGETFVELLPGVSIDRGFVSPVFITDAKKGEAILEKPLVFITDSKLRHVEEVIPILEAAANLRRPLLIIADAIDGQALQLLALNKLRGRIAVAAIEGPSFGENRGELLRDIAALTSAKIFSTNDASRALDIDESFFGSTEKVIISKDKTMFIQPNRNEIQIQERSAILKNKISLETENPYMLSQYQKRLADLTAKVASINVGAPTETEQREKKDRVEDALRATSAAVAKGYLIGGGTTLIKVSMSLPKDTPTQKAFAEALEEPFRVIVENAGKNSEVLLTKLKEELLIDKKEDYGFNARTMEFGNLKEQGVIDPALVVEQVVANAVSAAGMLILSNTSLVNVDRTPPYSPPQVDYA
jgi:chaperonin GroEL